MNVLLHVRLYLLWVSTCLWIKQKKTPIYNLKLILFETTETKMKVWQEYHGLKLEIPYFIIISLPCPFFLSLYWREHDYVSKCENTQTFYSCYSEIWKWKISRYLFVHCIYFQYPISNELISEVELLYGCLPRPPLKCFQSLFNCPTAAFVKLKHALSDSIIFYEIHKSGVGPSSTSRL